MLVLLSLIGAIIMLRNDPAPSPATDPRISFEPPEAGLPGRGFIASLSVTPDRCGSLALISVVYAGSADYWIDHPKLPRAARFDLRLPGRVQQVSARLTDEIELRGPYYAPGRPGGRLKYKVLSEKNGVHITGTVRDWGHHRDALKVNFIADWGSPRTQGTCYLQVPNLTADLAGTRMSPSLVRTAAEQLDPDRSRSHARGSGGLILDGLVGEPVSFGRIQVSSTEVEVVAESSRRPPDDYVSGRAIWSCEHSAWGGKNIGVGPYDVGARAPDQLLGKGQPSRSVDSYVETLGKESGCSASVVLAGSSAAFGRDLALILISALASLGLGVLILERTNRIGSAFTLMILGAAAGTFTAAAATGFALTTGEYLKLGVLTGGLGVTGGAVAVVAGRLTDRRTRE